MDDRLAGLPQASMSPASGERIRARAQARLARLHPAPQAPALPSAPLHPMLRATLFTVSAIYVAGAVLTLVR